MIRYDLKCSHGHSFDSWFGSSDDFDKLKRLGLMTCAVCGEDSVTTATLSQTVTKSNTAPLVGRIMNAKQAVAALKAGLVPTADNTCSDFADDTRRMHYDETDVRAVFERAKAAEAKALADKGDEITHSTLGGRKGN